MTTTTSATAATYIYFCRCYVHHRYYSHNRFYWHDTSIIAIIPTYFYTTTTSATTITTDPMHYIMFHQHRYRNGFVMLHMQGITNMCGLASSLICDWPRKGMLLDSPQTQFLIDRWSLGRSVAHRPTGEDVCEWEALIVPLRPPWFNLVNPLDLVCPSKAKGMLRCYIVLDIS